MALWMLAAPFVAGCLGLLLGRWRSAAAGSAIAGTAVSLLIAVVLWTQQPWEEPIATFGLSGDLEPLPFATLVDGLAVVVATMVAFVALLVQIYSVRYMRGEARYASYSAFVSLFTAAMLAVVVAGDLLLLVIGWEVMGLCSYLLIGQRWERSDARRAAVKAFLVTKFGDVGFIVGIIVLLGATNSVLLTDVVSAAANDATVATVASLLLFVGVMGKSAQFPLHAWLPDAMAGPSPVSALIHAATMVAAGIYVIARMYPMFLASDTALTVMAIVACIGMLGAALAAYAQQDIKRVLAWSTISQLAYMVAALSVGARDAAVFHMLSHAFFKALLFLGAGAVIHVVGTNLMRDMGGLRRAMPVTFVTMSIGLLALVGVAPLAGFFSKESVLVAAEHAARGDAQISSPLGLLVLTTAFLTIAVTAAYAFRLWVSTFLGPVRNTRPAHEAPAGMWWPLVVLTVPILGFGFLALVEGWLPTWIRATAISPDDAISDLSPGAVTVGASVIAVLVGLSFAWVGVRHTSEGSVEQTRAGRVAAGGFGVDGAYRLVAEVPFRALSRAVAVVDDSVVIPTVQGVGRLAMLLGRVMQELQHGNVQRYLSTAVSLVIVAVVFMLVSVAT
jgi:NADH-quinone oxidoreductase subunit L